MKQWINKRSFNRAQKKAGPNQMVCGVISAKGKPVYFLADRDADNQFVEDQAFLLRNGREPSGTERTLGVIARGRNQLA